MVLDTSSVVAIFRLEPEAPTILGCLAQADGLAMSAANVLESSLVLRGLKQIGADETDFWLDRFLESGEVEIAPVTQAQIVIARYAHRIYGKGGGHCAQLNYGDCFAYALAKTLDAPLLFKGGDFSHTDVVRAL
jgi:ribonuclease VapC